MTDRSSNPTVVEYAVQNMMKGQSPSVAAKNTVKSLSGHENMFLGPGVTVIDAKKLETELWLRMVEFALKIMSRYPNQTAEDAMQGTLLHFQQATLMKSAKPGVVRDLKENMVAALGRNPFKVG